ncbi:hypothetical protein HNR62_001604 [Oceanisphaera litoralis]|uniref:PilZ domain-containing protein n=1 Tax=Oceanisphaera litoralis TaxID=225144 RepID=UPI00195937E3|nr:PilZ domain-containing protein [Oceanisphaera litoralis]MBM7455731.1 hypothetical protein [Oceanisphaera litoralis]
MDLSRYKALLDKLVPLSYHHELDGLLDTLLPEAAPGTRFKLQAEVRRLTSPCLRVLDLRNLFPDQCRLVRHQGLDHMLPEPFEQRFMTLLQDFNGDYTRGLYETLLAELEALRQRPLPFNATPWRQPAQGIRRKESRLRFVTPVWLHLGDERIRGNSLDISAAGLLVQLSISRQLPEQLRVSFPELAKLPGLACLATPRRYRLYQSPDEPERLKMQRQDEDPDWQQALTLFIEQKRPRYGLDAEDLYSAVQSQCWGQVLLENGLGLSLFFDVQGELQNILANRHGGQILSHWQQDTPGDLMGTLLPPERVLSLGRQPQQPHLLYSFRHKGQSQMFHFVAGQHELEQRQAYATFINEGLRSGSLHCYYLSIRPLNLAGQARDTLDLLGVRTLKQLKWQLWLTPLPIPITSIATEIQIQQLSPFIRPIRQRLITITPLGRQSSKRQETRFKFQSAVELTLGGQHLAGQIQDLSCSGMKVSLSQPIRLEVPCLVQVNLVELGQRSRKWKLKNLPYRVLNQSGGGKVLHLHIEGAKETHVGFQFVTALLEQNQDKLRVRPETDHTPSWINWLCRQAQQQPPAPTFMLGRNDEGFYVQGAIACQPQHELMSFLSDEDKQAHFSRLVSRQLLQSIITQLLRPDGKQHLCLEIWTAADKSGKEWLQVNPTPARRHVLMDSRQTRALRVSLLVVNRLQLRQLDYVVPERDRLTKTSLYKTQLLEQQLVELAAMCQVFDITDMVRWRQTLTAPAVTPAPLPDSAG